MHPPLMEQSLISKIPTTCTSFGLYVRIYYYLQLSVYAYGVAELMYARAWALKVWCCSFRFQGQTEELRARVLLSWPSLAPSQKISTAHTTTTESLL